MGLSSLEVSFANAKKHERYEPAHTKEKVMTYLTEINYDKIIEKSLKNVIKEGLKIAVSQGLPGEHHFYITFKTNHPHVKISDYLKQQYPIEMTIVLQHQFQDLQVFDNGFSVVLGFSGVPTTLEIGYDAISYFADPHAKFGLSFNVDGFEETDNSEEEEKEEEPLTPKTPATVIDISAFRKK